MKTTYSFEKSLRAWAKDVLGPEANYGEIFRGVQNSAIGGYESYKSFRFKPYINPFTKEMQLAAHNEKVLEWCEWGDIKTKENSGCLVSQMPMEPYPFIGVAGNKKSLFASLEEAALFAVGFSEKEMETGGFNLAYKNSTRLSKEVFAACVKRKPELVSFEKQVTAVAESCENFPNNFLMVGATPPILSKLGFVLSYPLLISSNKFKDIISPEDPLSKRNQHDIPLDIAKRIPNEINNPAMIVQCAGDNAPESILIVTSLVDKKNRPIVVAAKEGTGQCFGRRGAANIVLSVYGRNDFSWFVKEAVEDDRVLYIDKIRYAEIADKKGKGQKQEEVQRIQYPLEFFSVSGFSNSITQFRSHFHPETFSYGEVSTFNQELEFSQKLKLLLLAKKKDDAIELLTKYLEDKPQSHPFRKFLDQNTAPKVNNIVGFAEVAQDAVKDDKNKNTPSTIGGKDDIGID